MWYSSELPDGLTRGDAEALLELLRQVAFRGRRPTIRIARWVSVLRSVKAWSNYYELFNVARLYAERERWAVINDEELDTTDLDFYVSYKGYEGYENAVDRGYVKKIDAVDFVKANFLPEGASLTGESPKCEKVVLLVRKLQDLSQVEVEGDRPDRVLLTLMRVPKKALQYFFDGLEEAIADSAAPLKSFDNLVARLNIEQQRLIFPMGDLTATPPPPPPA